ncbi:MAG: nucleotidyl transferase AbiEii/AbiGii toxin family protein [Planctomycetota bacterium]|nr:MAG: nucleotidyl transferase AbiEii/AbiGii toxin family protein [Planctomycetota bacterium]
MIDAANLAPADRQDLLLAASERAGKHPVILEKDFWVSWLLNLLFADPRCADDLIFKGGTSLSKAYGLIERFSEDIDLIVRYERLGFVDNQDPHALRSRSKQQQLNQAAVNACRSYISGDFCNLVIDLVARHLDDAVGPWSIHPDPNQPDSLLFSYPPSLDNGLSYIAPQVRLELGPHAATVPQQPATITPYLQQVLPDLVSFTTVPIATIAAERTFWEKVTILHAEAHRPGRSPGRYSRHYSDTVMMARDDALLALCKSDLGLLTAVREHKTKFYYAQWARYDEARPGSLRLVPSGDQRRREIAQDYRDMRPMFFTEPPPFQVLLAELAALEQALNQADH